MEIKNLKKVAARVKKAVKNKEKIVLYGDADLDGISSVIILKEAILNLGGEIAAVYFPDREVEGYGISETALNYLKKFAPALLLVSDCGIGNFSEVKKANKLGFEVIIIDHHEVLDKLPEASIIVDPKQKGDKYPFKGLAATGIVYKLSQILLGEKMTESLKKSFLELTVLATIADMMPQEEENKIIIEEGLASLESSWRPGIQTLLQTEFFKNSDNLRQAVSKIISILNVRDVENRLPAGFRLLTLSSSEEIKKIIEQLLEKNQLRKQRIKETIEEVKKRLSETSNEFIIFEGASSWEFSWLGSIASIICREYKKPTFIFKKGNKETQGGVRAPSGINSVQAMKSCAKLLETYGGHPAASGFRVKNENLEKFKECLINYFRKL